MVAAEHTAPEPPKPHARPRMTIYVGTSFERAGALLHRMEELRAGSAFVVLRTLADVDAALFGDRGHPAAVVFLDASLGDDNVLAIVERMRADARTASVPTLRWPWTEAELEDALLRE